MANQRQRERPRKPRNDSSRKAVSSSSPSKTALLVGASTSIGNELAVGLKRRGYWVRGLTRTASKISNLVDEVYVGDLFEPNTYKKALSNTELIISVVGAPLRYVGLRSHTASFVRTDYLANYMLLNEALIAKVPRFCYVGLYGGRVMGSKEVFRAQESLIAMLRAAAIRSLIIRSVPVFASFEPLLAKGRRKSLRVIGDGSAQLNPIHQSDLADVVCDAITANYKELDVGGPQIMTRREISELALASWQRDPKVRRLPRIFANYWSRFAFLRGYHNQEFSALESAMLSTDIIAPHYGQRTLAQYFAEKVDPISNQGLV